MSIVSAPAFHGSPDPEIDGCHKQMNNPKARQAYSHPVLKPRKELVVEEK